MTTVLTAIENGIATLTLRRNPAGGFWRPSA
jgi:hypothetical protein